MRTASLKFRPIGLFGFVFPMLFSSCQWVSDIFPSDEKPQILSVHIPGVPDENISIDQDKLTVSALLPDTLVSLKFSPAFKLSKRAELLGNPPTIDLTTYCPCAFNLVTPNNPISQPVDLQQGSQTNHYRLILKSQAPLRFRPFKAPATWDYKSDPVIYLPVANYYGADFAVSIAVTKIGSGKPIAIGGEGCFDVCAGRLNQIGIPLSGYTSRDSTGNKASYLTPGLYDLDVSLADGTKAHAAGAILVK